MDSGIDYPWIGEKIHYSWIVEMYSWIVQNEWALYMDSEKWICIIHR